MGLDNGLKSFPRPLQNFLGGDLPNPPIDEGRGDRKHYCLRNFSIFKRPYP